MALSKKDDPRRRLRSIKMHTVFLIKPILVAALVTAAWYQLWTRGIHFSDKDEAIIVGAVILSLSVVFSAFASAMFPKTLDKFGFLTRSVFKEDWNGFMMMRDERPPIRMNLMLGVTAVSWVFMLSMIHYHGALLGACSMFFVTLCVSTAFFATTELNNPMNSPWFRERVPHEMLTMNVDEYFKVADARARVEQAFADTEDHIDLD
jgi:hypothetical protein